jgi:M6 family metalloprotease-like protein
MGVDLISPALLRCRSVFLTVALALVAGGGVAVAATRTVQGGSSAASASAVVAPVGDFAPADTEAQMLRQPDGTLFRADLTPATQGGLFETALGGYSVARDHSGVWRYVLGRTGHGALRLGAGEVGKAAPPAGLAPHAGRAVTKVDPTEAAIRASIQSQLAAAARKAQLAAGGQGVKVRVYHVPALLLATWWDTSKGQSSPQFQKGHGPAYFKNLLAGFGGNPRGSVTQFYYQASFGQFLVKIDVYGPYVSNRSRQNRCYYGGLGNSPDSDTDPVGTTLGIGGGGALGMALEAVPQANKDIGANWGKYDNNGDGRVDFTIIIHSGADMAVTGNPCNTWSHALQATLGEGEAAENEFGLKHGTLARSGIPTSTPGVFVDRVLTIPEFESSTDPLTIGVASHEMAHSLGEPDYYDTSYNSVGTGDYDIMSGGSYLGDPIGSNPAMFNPATRVFQGWLTPTIVHSSLRDYTIRPRTQLPFNNYHVGIRDPNLLLIPTYEVKQGQKDNLGHTWSADDVYGLAKDPKTKKYVVEGFYIENVAREARAKRLHKGDHMGAMFDRMQHGSGLIVWHFDYWRQSTTYFAHSNDAQNDPNRYQMDVEEFDQNDNSQELQLNDSRGNASDYLVGAATGITSGTRMLPPHTPKSTGHPQKPSDISGTTPPGGSSTDTFVVNKNKNNYQMTVTAGSTNPGGDCKLQLTDPTGKSTPTSDSSGAGAPETITVKQPMAGKWKATVSDFAGCAQWTGRVIFSGPGGFLTAGAADTWSNWSHKPTGWAITNVSGYGNGLDESDEAGGSQNITLDVLNLKHRVDVSPGFVTGKRNPSGGTGSINAGQRNAMNVPVFSNGGKAPGKATVVVHRNTSTGPVVARRTVKLGRYQRKNVHFAFRPAAEGPVRLVTVVDPAHRIKEGDEHNNVQQTSLWAGPRKPRVLIVDDDETLLHERAIAGALASLGVRYAICTSHPSVKTMRHYSAVIWEAGVDRYEGQLDKYDRANLRRYLNGGGKLLITSNRIFDAVGVGQTATTPQSTAEGVRFGAQYLGERQPNGNSTYVDSMERFGTVTGRGLLAHRKLRVEPSAARKFVGLAGLAQAGAGGLGTVIKPLGTARGIATLDKKSMAGVQPAKDTPFIGIAVDGDAKHHHFKTVTLGWNLGDDTDAANTVHVLQPILRHFGVRLHRYTVHTRQPLIFDATVRDQIRGVATPITAIVLGGHKAVVTLHYRRHGRGKFYAVRMRKSGARGAYVATIPANAVTPDGVDYYITAGAVADPYGAKAGKVYHGIGVSLPVVRHPKKIKR